MKDNFAFGAGLAVVAAVVGYLIFRKAKAAGGDVIDTVTTAINPANPENLVNRLANYVTGHGDGSQSTIGTSIYDFAHPFEKKQLEASSLAGQAQLKYLVDHAPMPGVALHRDQEDGSYLVYKDGVLLGYYHPGYN